MTLFWPPRRIVALLLLGLLGLTALPASRLAAQTGPADIPPPPGDLEAAGADTDPTKPVLFSFRDEYFDLGDDRWQNVLVLRVDRVLLKRSKLIGNARGLVSRIDVPAVRLDRGADAHEGLGDVYAQALALPRLTPRLVLACGIGMSAPTATAEELGLGKWVAAPAVAPVWFFPGKGLAFVKVQDWFSVAGSSGRDDVHYLTVTPTFLWRLSGRWWTVLSAESKTDWQRDAATNLRSSVQLGYMVSTRFGVSLTVDLYTGDQPRPEVGLRAALFKTRF